MNPNFARQEGLTPQEPSQEGEVVDGIGLRVPAETQTGKTEIPTQTVGIKPVQSIESAPIALLSREQSAVKPTSEADAIDTIENAKVETAEDAMRLSAEITNLQEPGT